MSWAGTAALAEPSKDEYTLRGTLPGGFCAWQRCMSTNMGERNGAYELSTQHLTTATRRASHQATNNSDK